MTPVLTRLSSGALMSGAIVLALAACTTAGPVAPQPTAAPDLVAAARNAAAAAADGTRPGGTLNLLGLLSGDQLTQYLGTLEPFEEATGIDIKYETTGDLFAVLQTRLTAGSPPDVVSNPSAGQMRELARAGKLVAIDAWLPMETVRQQFPAGMLDLASIDGTLYGVFYNTSIQNLVWYNPKSYDGPKPPGSWAELHAWARERAAGDNPPWCIGLESGTASGWPGAAWIEQFLLRQSGPATYDDWWQGRLSWTSPQVKAAFEAFGQVAAGDGMVAGGPTAVLTTSFNQSPEGLYATPPRCALTVQAEWLGNTLAQTVPNVQPLEDIDFFTFPAVAPEHAGLLETSGELIGAFTDTPQTKAFMRYLATPEFGALVATTGQWLSANKTITPERYPSVLARKAAKAYAGATDVRYAAQVAMPLAMQTAFLKAVLDYVKEPAQLDAILARVDAQRRTAYAS